jgi:single-strand DNA-binding protein
LSGRLGREVTLKDAGQTKVGNTVLAVDDGYGDKKQTYWINLQLWGKTAEVAEQFTTKGSKVLVEGKIVVRQWEDKDGNKRTDTSVNVANIEFLDEKKTSGQVAKELFGDLAVEISDNDLPF